MSNGDQDYKNYVPMLGESQFGYGKNNNKSELEQLRALAKQQHEALYVLSQAMKLSGILNVENEHKEGSPAKLINDCLRKYEALQK